MPYQGSFRKPFLRVKASGTTDTPIWGVPKIRGTSLGVLILRTIVFWGLYWVPLFWETTISSRN